MNQKYKNNPLNIRYSAGNKWKGQTGQNRGFVTFLDWRYGLRAAAVLLRTYLRKGINTPRAMITRFAPPEDGNSTELYITFVCTRSGLRPDQIIDGDDQIYRMMSPMAYMETMTKVSPEQIEQLIKEVCI